MKARELREDEHLGATISIEFESGSRFQGVIEYINHIDYCFDNFLFVGFADFDDIQLSPDQTVYVFWPNAPWKDMGVSEQTYKSMFGMDYSLHLGKEKE